MCVICVADNDVRPSEKMVRDMWTRNSHGGGFAERWTDENGKVWVKWAKNLTLDQMIEKCALAPLPYVAHFRIASTNGGDRRASLCHPFELSENPTEALEGMTDNAVLFHNGDWKEWRTYLIQACFKFGYNLPPGKMSDTRVMAFISFLIGPYFMDFIEQKGVVFGPDWCEVFDGSEGWKKINGVLCSNDRFIVQTYPANFHLGNNGQRTGEHTASNKKQGNDVDPLKCRARGCGAAILLADRGACDKHKHMREQPRLLFPARQANGVDVCMDCGKAVKVPQDHAINCKHAPKVDEGKSCKVGRVVCKACKKELVTGNEHDSDCRLKSFGRIVELGPTSKVGFTGGNSNPDPFLVVLAAEEAKNEGKFGKKVFQKIAERWGFGGGKWHWAKQARMAAERELKDARISVVTH